MFRNVEGFCSEVLSVSRQTPMLEDHPLSPSRECLFSLFAATIHIWRPFLHPRPEDAPCRCVRDQLIVVKDHLKLGKVIQMNQLDATMIY